MKIQYNYIVYIKIIKNETKVYGANKMRKETNLVLEMAQEYNFYRYAKFRKR
jgi:hypothetical protein